MPLIWRLTSPAYAHVLDGEGARVAGGRWNSPGRRVVYASSHLSLSVLEVFVHIPPSLRDDLPARIDAVREQAPPSRRTQVLRDMCVIARADGHVQPEECRVLRDIAERLELGPEVMICSMTAATELD